MNELDELIKAIHAGNKQDAFDCLIRYIEFSEMDDDDMHEQLHRVEVMRHRA